MNRLHRTETGTVELVGEWRDGQSPRANPDAPAHFALYYDNMTEVFRFTGKRLDAMKTVGSMHLHGGRMIREGVIRMAGNRLYHEPTPDGLWIGEPGAEYVDSPRFPDIICC